MSAAEKLRALDGGDLFVKLHDALPQIVLVVEAAEQLPEFFYSKEGHPHSFVPLLAALDEKLGAVT